MYAVIVGGGKVGYYLVKELLQEGHEVLVIELDPALCERFEEEFGSVVLQGDGCEVATLEEAGVGRADVFIAVTGEDEDNLVACQVAKHLFKVPRTIARLNNPKNEPVFRQIGVDITISATNLILSHIQEELPAYPLVHLMTLRSRLGLEVVELQIPRTSSAVGKRLAEIALPAGSLICCLVKEDRGPQIPGPETRLEAEDQLIAVAPAASVEELRRVLTGMGPPERL
jgi:trk system potassium uptake protein TrkA